MISETKNTLYQTYNQQVQLFKLLSHPLRLAILEMLREGEHCVCHLGTHLKARQSSISQQIATLREAGMINDRRDGWNVYYRVADPRIFVGLEAIRKLTSDPQLTMPQNIVCPCPHCKKNNLV